MLSLEKKAKTSENISSFVLTQFGQAIPKNRSVTLKNEWIHIQNDKKPSKGPNKIYRGILIYPE